jgi:hypothetical protein
VDGQASKADGSMREVAQLALSEDWSIEAARQALAGDDIATTIQTYEAGLVPLADAESLERDEHDQFGPGMTMVRTWLKPIGMKIAPTMSEAQCSAWLTAVAMALSDLPAKVAAQAARAAIHIPMTFPNEVDGHVRAEALKIMDRHRRALRRLRALHDEIARAMHPQPVLTGPDPLTPFTADEIRKMTADVRSLGLKCGALTQQEIDAAFATPVDEAA